MMDSHQTQTDGMQADAHRRPSHMVSLLVVASALLAFLVWTRPCWSTGVMILSHFSLYWQGTANRGAMISLLVRICSPLLVALLVRTMIALWATINPLLSFPDLEEESLEASLPGLNEADDFPFNKAITQAAVSSAPAIARSPLIREKGSLPPSPAGSTSLEDGSVSQEESSSHKKVNAGQVHLSSLSENVPQIPAVRPVPAAVAATSTAPVAEPGAASSALAPHLSLQSSLPPVTITLLKELKITISAGQWQVPMPLKSNARTLQLIAYIAWRREARTRRGKLIEDIFGFGKDDEEATPKKLGEAFNSAKKSIRATLREAAGKLNSEAGQEIIDPHLDLFALDNEEYWLSRLCCVPDLETIEQQFRIIDATRGQHLLLPEVQEACLALLAAYQGDLLEDLIESLIQGEPEWENHWLRDPYTRYRDYYLTALWCRAEFLRYQGEHSGTEPDQQRSLFEEAARLYREYALHAIKSRFDSKMRRGEAEHGLRYAFRMYASTGNTHEAGKAYQMFSELVAIQFPEWDWHMSKKTEEAWRLVQQQTREFLPLPVSTKASD